MRTLFISAALAALLAACSPPAQRDTDTPQRPSVEACNSVTPDLAQQVRVQEELAVASAAADLRGGRITPGVYDLISARRIGAATGWQGTRAVALEVSEGQGGVVFNLASVGQQGDTDSWTATFTDTPENARLAYTCGRMGEVTADFSASADSLELRLPDGANGSLALSFQRRA